MDKGNKDEAELITTMEFRGTEYSAIRSNLALALWLGAIHFDIALVLVALFLFPAWLATMYICKYVCGYFPVTLHVEDVRAFDPNQAYVFGYEPHSVIPIGFCTLVDHTGLLPLTKIKILATSAVFYTPFLRHIWTWFGMIPVTKKNFYQYLSEGYSCILVPGGIREMLYMNRDSEVIFLKERKGFVRIALETGRPIVPVFCFGQSNVYNWWKPRGKLFVQIARILKFPILISWGRFGSPIPFQHPVYVVVGRPIELIKNPKPTVEEINEVHAKFISSMQELFEKYKRRAGYPDLMLQIM